MGKRRDDSRKPWTIFSDRGVAMLNATIAGARVRRSLGIAYDPVTASARDVRAVEAAAARKYAELVAGRVVVQQARIMTSLTLHELFALWLVDAEKLWPRSVDTRVSQIGTVETWATEAPRFKGNTHLPIERLLDDAGPAQFMADRLGAVLRDSVSGEISNLYRFFEWALREKHISSVPPRPKLPRGALGVRSGPQRAKPVDITAEEALAICAALPEWTAKGGGKVRGPGNAHAIRVRDRFRLCWELALRPGIVEKISVPEHYVLGQDHLWISRDIDKVGLERKIQLTSVARDILERCAPAEGLVFGAHNLTDQIKKAALAVLPPEKAKHFARYDLRHGRAVHTLEVTNDLLGTSRILGHMQMTTTNRYVRTREAHAAKVIAALEAHAQAQEAVRTTSGTSDEGPRESAPGGGKPVKAKKNAARDHSLAAPASLRLPGSTADSRCRDLGDLARQCATGNVEDPSPDVTVASAVRPQSVPAVVTAAMRQQAVTAVVWDAFDMFSLHAMGLDLEEVDS